MGWKFWTGWITFAVGWSLLIFASAVLGQMWLAQR